MKKLLYALYAFVFNIFSLAAPLKPGRVALVSPHNADLNDGLGQIKRELDKRGGFQTVFISRRDLEIVKGKSFTELMSSLRRALAYFTKKAYLLATSKTVFLNDNFMPMAGLRFKKEAVVVQLWHAEGVFKKFGQAQNLPAAVAEREAACNRKLSYVVCSSESVAPYYAEAFGVPLDKVLPFGSPRADYFFEERDTPALRDSFDEAYPVCKSKGLILYAPTFRDNPENDRVLLEHFDFGAFEERFGDRYTLLVRLHPQVHASAVPNGAVDVTDWKNVGELVLLCDKLITDYSSICMDFALLGKPCVFYAFDLVEYTQERNFYFDYKTYVPGPVAETFDELIDAVEAAGGDDAGDERLQKFRSFNFGEPDGKAAERVVDFVFGKEA